MSGSVVMAGMVSGAIFGCRVAQQFENPYVAVFVIPVCTAIGTFIGGVVGYGFRQPILSISPRDYSEDGMLSISN